MTVSVEARPAPAKATSVSTPNRYQQARATTVSDNRPSWPTGPGRGARGWRGPARQRANAPNHTSVHQAPPVWRAPEGWKGRLRCPWAVAGPGRASRRRTKPHVSAPGPTGVEGAGGTGGHGRASRRSTTTRQHTRRRGCGGRRRVRRARAGFEIDHSERSSRVAISRAAGPSGARNTSGATRHIGTTKPPSPTGARRLRQSERGSAQDHDNVRITETAFLTDARNAKLRSNVLGGSFHARVFVEDGGGLGGPSVSICGAGSRIAGLVQDLSLLTRVSLGAGAVEDLDDGSVVGLGGG